MLCLFGLVLKKMDRLNSVLPNGSFVCHSAKGVAQDQWVHCLIKVTIRHQNVFRWILSPQGGIQARCLTGQLDQLLRHNAMWHSNRQTTVHRIFFFDQEEAVFSEWVLRKPWYLHLFCGETVLLFIYWTSQKTGHKKDILLKKKLEQDFPRKDVTFPADPE